MPDRYCYTEADGSCISNHPLCMHQPWFREGEHLRDFFAAENWEARVRDVVGYIFLEGYKIIEEAGDDFQGEYDRIRNMAPALLYAILKGRPPENGPELYTRDKVASQYGL